MVSNRKVESLFLLLVSAFILGIPGIAPAHSSPVGVVCISDIGSSSCILSPTPPAGGIGSQVEVAVNIQDSATLNGFDIYVKTDPRILNPVSTDLAGTVLGPNYLVAAQCIGEAGSGCSTFQTGPGVVRLAAVALAFLTTPPTTGRLFSIKYNIASLDPSTISFQTGCSLSSTTSNSCVVVVYGSQIVPVTISPDTTGPGDFTMVSAPDRIIVPRGQFRLSSVTIASVGGFLGGVSLKVEIAPRRGPNGPVAFFLIATPGVFLPPGTSTILNVEVVALKLTPLGGYTVTVTGTSGSLSHSASFPVTVTR